MNPKSLPNESVGSQITISHQGSFYIGGKEIMAPGVYDPALPEQTDAGQSYWVDQMYVQYQIPVNPRKLPLVFVHGGGGTGSIWETTPDGREGFQTIFLRRGYPVYIVDAPGGGRSGFSSFNGEFGRLNGDQQIIPNHTDRPGRELAWIRWRLGPNYPDVFPVQAFPIERIDQFLKHIRPVTMDDANSISGALLALLDKIGPSVLVTHSKSGLWGWLAGCRSFNVRAIVSYEPSVVFPQAEMPAPLPLYKGTRQAGLAVTETEFGNLAKVPLQVVFGDNIPEDPVRELPADDRRVQVVASRLFVDMINNRGGNANVMLLPDIGLRGNSHFMFMDTNNLAVADQLSSFLASNGLDRW